MDFERRHVLGNLLRDKYEDLFEESAFCEIVDRMNGTDGFFALQDVRICPCKGVRMLIGGRRTA
ncbi:hypothetical protein NKH23_08345 [Mesorhizobium sp. M1328]|uniref:hypothetical protein n=1 Tax=Mesorhizobium sp. M1328 TaxID=2957082 RepID=UPI00333A4D7F